ncbi:hypothetical protein E2C01_079958 [Portunus trituberculatus]|uniref:Uncharacterized protein n=1 Tax=Portunus trituberculatus TaxID=210409 RepID=A0A5B7IRW8_PORTR|nr:hypothetical protein [Portunus trituberculatus]
MFFLGGRWDVKEKLQETAPYDHPAAAQKKSITTQNQPTFHLSPLFRPSMHSFLFIPQLVHPTPHHSTLLSHP